MSYICQIALQVAFRLKQLLNDQFYFGKYLQVQFTLSYLFDNAVVLHSLSFRVALLFPSLPHTADRTMDSCDAPRAFEFAPPPLAVYGPLASRDSSFSQVLLSAGEASASYMSTKSLNHIGVPSLITGSVTCTSGHTVIAPNAQIIGDLAPVSIGEGCLIESNTVLRPCS